MYPKAYVDFLVMFHGPRDYFECHEILEEYWKQNNTEGKESIWVGLIQISVALYHQRIGNFNGAARTLNKALTILKNKSEEIRQLGLDAGSVISLLEKRMTEIEDMQSYHSLTLPIIDSDLLQTCMDYCSQIGFEWNSPSDLSNDSLIRKHSLRKNNKNRPHS